jgi:tetratricopeptide (TPR) repeat protein
MADTDQGPKGRRSRPVVVPLVPPVFGVRVHEQSGLEFRPFLKERNARLGARLAAPGAMGETRPPFTRRARTVSQREDTGKARNPLERMRKALAWFLGAAALPMGILFSIRALVDDVHFSVFGFETHAGAIKNTGLFLVTLCVLAKLIAPEVPFARTPIGRVAGAVLGFVSSLCGPRHTARRRVSIALLALIGVGVVYQRARVRLNVAAAERLVALGDSDGAAACYGRAASGLTLDQAELLSRQGYAYFRGGRFQECVDTLRPRFERGGIMNHKGYQALWKCCAEIGRYDEAIRVVRAAMARFPKLGTECTGTLAVYERKRLARPGVRVPVRLSFGAPADAPGSLFLTGNWSDAGYTSQIHGWEPVAMDSHVGSNGRLRWTAEIALEPTAELPYTALVLPGPEPFESRALGLAVFMIPNEYISGQIAGPFDVELEPLAPDWELGAPRRRKRGADGRRRVLALWPDCGSWFILNFYAHMGQLPNAARLLGTGTRLEMISTNPPMTATAYRRMVEMDDGSVRSAGDSLVSVVGLQLKGLPFLDRLIPSSVAAAEERETIFSVLETNGLSWVNLFFNDEHASAENDRMLDGRAVHMDPSALDNDKSVSRRSREALLRDVLRIDPASDRAARLLEYDYFWYGVKNNEAKARAGLDVWQRGVCDFLLLRLPAVDLMSHAYYAEIEKQPAANPLQEIYRQFDTILGEFAAELDDDDTLILVSDHGIWGTMHHDPACILILEGPDVPADRVFGTIPIGHFPSFVLSRFGIEAGSERLTAEERELLYPR